VSLDAIGVVVEDMDRAREFYRHLGLELPEDDDHTEVELAGGIRLMFDTEDIMRQFDPSWSRATGSPSVTLAFSFETPAEVDAKHEELVAAGGRKHLEPWDAFWGMRYAVLRDPDGNEISLYARLPQDSD
jgi:catechol 2,3-dioxygenase-like lactoylglutathione lyase family enzyme